MAMLGVLIGLVIAAAIALACMVLFEQRIVGWTQQHWASRPADTSPLLVLALVAVSAFAAGLLVMFALR